MYFNRPKTYLFSLKKLFSCTRTIFIFYEEGQFFLHATERFSICCYKAVGGTDGRTKWRPAGQLPGTPTYTCR